MIQQQTIGRGKVYLATMPDGNTPGKDFKYVGNTTSFKFNSEPTTLDHFSSDDSIRLKDQSVLLGVDYKTEMVTDNLDSTNVARFFLNDKGSLTQGVVAATLEALASISNGHSYQLGVTQPTPAGVMGLDPTGIIVQVNPLGALLVENVDYVLDLTSGIIHFLEASTIAVDGVSIDVTYALLATTRDTIITGDTQLNMSVRYIADNPIGQNRNWYIPKTLISPSGDYELKTGDDWGSITFAMEALKLTGYEIAYANGHPV